VHTQVQTDNAHCGDEIETGVGADGRCMTPVHILHIGMGSAGLGQAKSATGRPT